MKAAISAVDKRHHELLTANQSAPTNSMLGNRTAGCCVCCLVNFDKQEHLLGPVRLYLKHLGFGMNINPAVAQP